MPTLFLQETDRRRTVQGTPHARDSVQTSTPRKMLEARVCVVDDRASIPVRVCGEPDH